MTAGTRNHPHATTAPHRHTADERRAEIIEAAVRVFGAGGLAGSSTEDIARLAGVSQPYLFRLFGTKRDLFLAAVERAFDRVTTTFEEAAKHPATDDAPVGIGPVLMSMGRSYDGFLEDRSLLDLQLHAFAACGDPVVRVVVRERFTRLVARVAQLSGDSPEAIRRFFAEGMLANVVVAMDLAHSAVGWQTICDGGAA